MTEEPVDTLFSARGRMEIAQQRMLSDYPFHARLLARWQTHADAAVKTMGVATAGGSVILYYNPEFVNGCTLPELVGVLLHETHHVLFGHLHLDRARFPDARALSIAEEVTCNEHIREPLPGSPLLLTQFPELPADEDTLTRYRRLAGSRRLQKTGSRDEKAGRGTPKTGRDVPNSSPRGRNSGLGEQVSDGAEGVDDHVLRGRNGSDTSAAELAVRVMVRETADELTPDEWGLVPGGLKKRIKDLTRGDGAGSGVERTQPGESSRVDWRRLLRRYLRSHTALRPSYARPPRRFPDLIGVSPGRLHRPDRPRVMVVVDTSGSVGPEQLGQISAELDRLASACEMTVVECDARVQAVYPHEGKISCFRGRGGTDLRPPFDQSILKRIWPDLVLVFTDGFGPAPSSRPRVPTIWCLTRHGRRPAGWGLEVRLPV